MERRGRANPAPSLAAGRPGLGGAAVQRPPGSLRYSFFFRSSCWRTQVWTALVTFLLLLSILRSLSRKSGINLEEKVNGVRGLLTRFSFTLCTRVKSLF